jgi:hypothetical protein
MDTKSQSVSEDSSTTFETSSIETALKESQLGGM